MHELALTRSVVQTANEEAAKAGATKVRAIYLTIGYARDIVDELFEGCFEFLSRDTACAGAELVIERVPLMVRCRACDLVYHIDVHNEATWACPRCGKRDYVLSSGMEFQISKIEVE